MSQQTHHSSNLENEFVPILLNGGKEGLKNLLYYQLITKGLPIILGGSINIVKGIIQRKVKRHVDNISKLSIRQKTASVMLERDYEKENNLNILFDAILSYVSELPQTKHVKRTATGVFIMASDDEIEMSPCIYVRKVGEAVINEKITKLKIEVYSYTYDLGTLRKYMEEIENKYEMALSNQLGKNIFYFDEIPFNLPLGLNRKPDLSKAPPRLMFSKYPLHTNKSLKNIYGDSVKLIRKRVDFFMNNKRWYEEKGVPYTLGILLHGVPGAGKTSCIKSIAKDTNRHILNIRLSENTTVNQLNALFYSSQVQVLYNGENKFFDIPIDKRIIVLEDVDCLTDVVLSRDAVEETMKVIQQENDVKGKSEQGNTDELDDFGRRVSPYPINLGGTSGENQKLNLSVLLNILDGVLEQPGRILIMTSNHPEKLDRALIRPGRIDVIVKFDYCKRHEVIEIIEAFTGMKVDNKNINDIADGVYTPAEVTRIIFENIEDIDSIINNLCGKVVNKKSLSSDSFIEPTMISSIDMSYQDIMEEAMSVESHNEEEYINNEIDKKTNVNKISDAADTVLQLNENIQCAEEKVQEAKEISNPKKHNNNEVEPVSYNEMAMLSFGSNLEGAYIELTSQNDNYLENLFLPNYSLPPLL